VAIAVTCLGASVGILGLALWLTPDPAGMGTHEQLGLPPCSLVVMTGYPCPTCGMTTSFSNAVRGQLLAAFHAQPAGLVLAGLVFLVMLGALRALIFGKVWRINWYRVSPAWVALGVVAIMLLGWGYKVAIGVWGGTLPA